FKIVRTLAVLGLLVVPAAAGKISSGRMVCARQGSVAYAISIHVFVAGKISHAIQAFFVQHFAALNWLFRIFEWIGHPIIHSKIEGGHHKYEGLETLRQIESVLRHGEALFRGTWNQKYVFRIAMRKKS